MPTYEYACKSCGEHLEVVQSFKDAALTVCPNCDGELRKVFGNIGIAFKGSGFYRNDSRKKTTSASAKGGEAKSGDTKTADGKSDAKSDAKGETKAADSKSTSGKDKATGSASPAAASAS